MSFLDLFSNDPYKANGQIEPTKKPKVEPKFVWVVTRSTRTSMEKYIVGVFDSEKKADDYIESKQFKNYFYKDKWELL